MDSCEGMYDPEKCLGRRLSFFNITYRSFCSEQDVPVLAGSRHNGGELGWQSHRAQIYILSVCIDAVDLHQGECLGR